MSSHKPAIHLAVILPLLVGGNLLLSWLLLSGYAAAREIRIPDIPDAKALMLVLPGLILWIPLSLLIANRILTAIPSLRRVTQRHADATGGPDFKQSQRGLRIVFMIAAAVCLPIIASAFLSGR